MSQGRQRQIDAYELVFLGLAILIAIIWAVATIVQIIDPSRAVPLYANLMMAAVSGSFFGGAVISSRRRNGNDKAKQGLMEGEDPFAGPGGYYRVTDES